MYICIHNTLTIQCFFQIIYKKKDYHTQSHNSLSQHWQKSALRLPHQSSATASTSQSAPAGKSLTATQLRAGLLMKCLA